MKPLVNREYIYKTAVLLVFGMALYMGVSCSPVKFASNSNGCTVASPCVAGQGLMQVNQVFQFTATNKVDILVVDDNSGSMTTEQNNMSSSFNGFIGNLISANQTSGLDWQVAVTNTDVCGISGSNQPAGFCPGPSNVPGSMGQFMGALNSSPMYGDQVNLNIITPSTSNAAQTFANIVQRGSQLGSGDERAIYSVNLAINQAGGSDSGFFRSNSNLAVVILSDENERSVGGNCTETDSADSTQYAGYSSTQCDPGSAPLESNDMPSTLITNVEQTWAGAKALQVNSIIIIPNDTTMYPDPTMNGTLQTCLEIQAHQGPSYTAHPGSMYQQLSQQTGGIVGSICDNGQGAFAQMLSNITGNIANQPNSNIITLANTPSVAPVVTFTPAGNSVSWTWSGNKITFSQRPVSGTSVNVSYTYNP